MRWDALGKFCIFRQKYAYVKKYNDIKSTFAMEVWVFDFSCNLNQIFSCLILRMIWLLYRLLLQFEFVFNVYIQLAVMHLLLFRLW